MENKQKQRFYLLMVEQDIFSTWCLKRIWGSLLNRRGRTLVQVFESEKEAWLELTEIEYKKRQRGYIYADFDIETHLILKPQNLSEILIKKPIAQKPKSKEQEVLINPNQQELVFE